MNSKQRKKINRNDFHRALITETLPFETPIIFSDNGLYDVLKRIDDVDDLVRQLVTAVVIGKERQKEKFTIPYQYKIRKNLKEFRRLALPHPASQWEIKHFYEKYESSILYYCSKSPASIRAPEKVAGSYYIKNQWENLRQYNTGNILPSRLGELTKHNPSYFTYRGFDRLYKFFESRDYFELEKKYKQMHTLDVTKCFPSIYTHSISWATKTKNFAKQNIAIDSTFGHQFDELMKYVNYQETNGIIIGPEISRIFSEIIFQAIDLKAIDRLKKESSLLFDNHYTIRRYVDDIYIFSKSKETEDIVCEVYADELSFFNLYVNSAKSCSIDRPFVTKKSRLIQTAKKEVTEFTAKFLSKRESDVLIPKKIYARWRLIRSYKSSVKSLCSYNQTNYDEIAGFIISVLNERVKKIVAVQETELSELSDSKELLYRDAFLVILDIVFYLYQIAPSVNASYRLSTIMILIIRFLRKHLKHQEDTIAQRIYELTEDLLYEVVNIDTISIKDRVPLEKINIVLAAGELGENYLLPEPVLKKIFTDNIERESYFNIISCLFYIKNHPQYNCLRKIIVKTAQEKLSDLSDIRNNSEKAHLFFDLFNCPYISDEYKSSWVITACEHLNIAQQNMSDKLTRIFQSTFSIFVNWKDIDLLASLEKKELKQVYE